MDIAINTPIPYAALRTFLEARYPEQEIFLLYAGVTGWEDLPEGAICFLEYAVDRDKPEGAYRYGLTIYRQEEGFLPFVESLARALSRAFNCGAFCDASRVVLDPSPYYVLLFEAGRVFLAEDHFYEETGEVSKVVELAYELPRPEQSSTGKSR